jgi:hypothetical protein
VPDENGALTSGADRGTESVSMIAVGYYYFGFAAWFTGLAGGGRRES